MQLGCIFSRRLAHVVHKDRATFLVPLVGYPVPILVGADRVIFMVDRELWQA